MSPRERPATSTSREKVYDFVRKRLLEGDPPTVREVQHALHFRAVQSAQEHLDALTDQGKLVRKPGKSRGYRLPDSMAAPVRIPLLGRISAGPLTTAFEDVEGYLSLEGRRGVESGDDRLFALKVRGDSMSGAGILDGDVVIVRRQRTADHGDIVVARVGDEATVKRLHLGKGRIALCPENPAYEPIVLEARGEPMILGRVIEVRRYLDGFGR